MLFLDCNVQDPVDGVQEIAATYIYEHRGAFFGTEPSADSVSQLPGQLALRYSEHVVPPLPLGKSIV
ncbi:hypothetical protein MCNF_00030 [Mycolicibacterium confluentis]|uniref:Uncharacterized protein n=1 Tax=Mycolicibacterium confluentis TaxID=28047 RepID=A0A7I7XQ95_9MYCO|nr:hypothetical protein MCNF_00030 [Mycolicibacterium confluentis]